MDPVEVLYWGLLVIAGCACGFLNTLASSGSAVSLPLLVALGMPEGVANATNRLPVMLGSVMATVTFARRGQVDWRAAGLLAPPAVVGAVVGVLTAEHLTDRDMGLVITGAVLLALLMLLTKIKTALLVHLERPPSVPPLAMALMFGIGFWLGLIVLDGATYLLLVLILVCAYDLPNANALKVLLLAVTTAVAILMFWSDGDLWLAEGLALSSGSVAGGHVAAKLSGYPGARRWAYGLLVTVIALEVLQLAWHYAASWRAGA